MATGASTNLSYGPGVFTDEEFEKAAKEVIDPDLDGWEFFVESHGTKIYRKYKEVGRANRDVVILIMLQKPGAVSYA